jgi:hypothetical protein
MNHFRISMKMNGKKLSSENNQDFREMFEIFLSYIEEAAKRKYNIDEPVLTYKDAILATDIVSIIQIGTAISGFDIMITEEFNGQCLMKYPYDIIIENVDKLHHGKDVKVNIVGRRQQIYEVFQSPVLPQNLKTYFTVWKNTCDEAQKIVQDYVINPVLKEEVDMNWTMEYYAPAELKKALALIDTNPEESKKILMVMDYMLSNKVNIQ